MDQLKLLVGRVLHDRYRITRQLGRGGMGAVYEAVDLSGDRTVAVKQMLPLDHDIRQAFEREARILSEVSHHGLPRVTDFFENELGLFMVMDYVAGDNLGQLLDNRRVPFPPHQVRRWAEDLLEILNYLHCRSPRVLHRDVKPSNLKLTPQGRISLLDFGLSKEWTEEAERSGVITDMCILAYTPHYAPLEQIQGELTSPRSDLYALGATLYHLLTGHRPPDALKRANMILCDGVDPLVPVTQLVCGIPAPLSSIVMKALALKPSARPSSAAEMLYQLRRGVIAPDFSRNTSPLHNPPLPRAGSAPEEVTVAVIGSSSEEAAHIASAQIVASAGPLSPATTGESSPARRPARKSISVALPGRPVTLTPPWARDQKPRQVVPLGNLRALARLEGARREGSKLRTLGRAAAATLALLFVAFAALVSYDSDFNPLRADRPYDCEQTHEPGSQAGPAVAPAPAPLVYPQKTPRALQDLSPALYVNTPVPSTASLTIEDLVRLALKPRPGAGRRSRASRSKRRPAPSTSDAVAPVRVFPSPSPDTTKSY